MRDPASMRFLHSVLALHQWPLLLSRTSYAHVITSIRPHRQYQQGTAHIPICCILHFGYQRTTIADIR